ncbi:MAG: polyprenyl synthetase family protein [Candidatus Omnitrophota bacterium]
MHYRIKNKIDRELYKFTANINRLYSLSRISPLLFSCIRDFLLRKGKRIRPILFIVGYLGFAKKAAPGLYTSALAIELLHDFMLVHDDIIDKSDKRRGKPSMHRLLDNYLMAYKDIKFNGIDLSLVVGDVMYAIAIKAFLSIKEDMARKEKALKKFIEAAIYTGSGEFIELINGVKNIQKITKQDIYKIYDYKTARYTFSTPLSTGAILAGATQSQVDKLFKLGIYLGRAFQIKDDILGIFGEEKKIGKSTLSDLQESKKTLLLWYAYNNSGTEQKTSIKKILGKNRVKKSDLLRMRKIINESGAFKQAEKEIAQLIKKAHALILATGLRKEYKDYLLNYSSQLLNPIPGQ